MSLFNYGSLLSQVSFESDIPVLEYEPKLDDILNDVSLYYFDSCKSILPHFSLTSSPPLSSLSPHHVLSPLPHSLFSSPSGWGVSVDCG